MDDFLNTKAGFETTCRLIETINRSTDDYLFIWDIGADTRWFFGDIDDHYNIRKDGSSTNNTDEMMKIIHPADRAAVRKSLSEIAAGKKDTHDMDYRWIDRNGNKVWINCHGTVIRNDRGEPHLMIGRVSEENLRHLFNPLTALWNKTKLRSDLNVRLNTDAGYLVFLDIDGLSSINLSHGRSYGDGLLKEVGEICEGLKAAECAYHIDHNNFALVLNVASDDEVRSVFYTVKEAMQDKCTFTAAAVPIDRKLFFDETQLLDSINMTLKKAKSISCDRIEFFSAEDLSKKLSSLALMEELKQSVDNSFEGFELYYQPQVRSGNYDIYGIEALLRYTSPSRGRVFPDEFIPILEHSCLIKDVGLWVLREACAQCKKWRTYLPELHVSVNFSVIQFEDADLAEKVVTTLKETGLDGTALTIEITESMELHNSKRLISTMKELRTYGISFAIDDFGTGYANLSYLKQLNVDEIKIDRVFVSGLERGTYNHNLISNVIEFAKINAIRTCCEGVESTHELAVLEALRPNVIQGYLFDRPNTADSLERTYFNTETPEYQKRLDFIRKIYEFKKKMGILHFDPKDILRENEVGLWVIRMKREEKRYELHADETMEKITGMDAKYTPGECYDYLVRRIHPDYITYVLDSMEGMISGEKAVQIEFPWLHPTHGDVLARFSGKRVKTADDIDDMIVLKGYYRIIADVAGA